MRICIRSEGKVEKLDPINIGMHKDGTVKLDMERASNRHIAIVGRSGSGKSVAGQKILKSILQTSSGAIVVFDLHHLFGYENIFPPFLEEIKKASNEIDAYSAGIPLPLFSPLKLMDGKMEDMLDVTTSISDILSSALKLGSRQKERLYDAVEFVAETDSYRKYGIAALGRALEMADDDKAAVVREKLYYILKRNVFVNGDGFLQNKKINVVRLSKFSESVQLSVVEIVLSYIWRLANSGAFLQTGLCLFLDECQNLNWNGTGIVSTILSEGRKLGIQLILITPTLGGRGKVDMTRFLLQAQNQLYFSPPENEALKAANLIGAKRSAYWQMQLKSLEVGECVVNGSLIINRSAFKGAVKIRI